MSRAKRQKIDRENLAAYSASQPLFDALRNATTKLSEQEARLTTARDVVQTLHVKIAKDDTHLAVSRHNRYMDAAVKAWHSATETYCAIFEQLVTITAADPTEGKEKGQRHEEFVSLLDTARKAEEAAKKFGAAHDISSEESDEDDEDEEPVEPAAQTNGTGKRPMVASENDEDSPPSQQSSKPTSNPSIQPQKLTALTDTRYDQSGTKILWRDGVLKVPVPSLTPDEKRAWEIVKTRQRRKDRRARMKGKTKSQREQNGTSTAEPNAAEAATTTQVPGVEYEDVSAEVEARLKAKADKKAAQKAKTTEKKRKRESADSFAAVDSGFTNAGGEEGEDPVETVKESVKEKPAKKKLRKSQEANEDTEPIAAGAAKPKAPAGGPSKRKKTADAEVEVKAEEGTAKANKKRKKTNA
ncbi:hypothetical protein M409DRAFT_61580 [Zasmidium cellare ATCC 36951]|uniref:Uncharacterized protein n=1 Tax=Zasmidium cellare ATCC 36951 TaxID=1080233 RepID=A0A6A6BWW9_ZASCE|nr:uncharacterized protein M409DRAFT_61580 [Zasmidium cellare ATCC 36951]KAF2158538.1 hypothetical protein M409DRAFT_61580 [Zasmidium cellare ATCC 36951]